MPRDKRIKDYKKKDGSTAYMFNIYIGKDVLTGKDKRITRRGFSTAREARLALIDVENNAQDLLSPSSHPTFETVYKQWFERYKETVKESTWVSTEVVVRVHVLPVIGKAKIDQLTPAILQDVVNGWYKSGYKRFKLPFIYTEKVFDYAYRLDIIKQNTMDKVILPRNPNKLRDSTQNYYEKDELLVFLEELKRVENPVIKNLFTLLIFTGMRVGEARALTWDDIDLTNGTISITKTVAIGAKGRAVLQSPKTAHGERIVEIDTNTLLMLKKWKIEQREWLFSQGLKAKPKQLVFSNSKNEFINQPKPGIWLKIITQRIQKKNPDFKVITVHGFRHTYATLAFEGGADIKEVQAQLGHSNFQTTLNIYTAVTKRKRRSVTEQFADFILSNES